MTAKSKDFHKKFPNTTHGLDPDQVSLKLKSINQRNNEIQRTNAAAL